MANRYDNTSIEQFLNMSMTNPKWDEINQNAQQLLSETTLSERDMLCAFFQKEILKNTAEYALSTFRPDYPEEKKEALIEKTAQHLMMNIPAQQGYMDMLMDTAKKYIYAEHEEDYGKEEKDDDA